MKVLVTGASGNVGSEVVPLLLDAGHEVFAGTRDGKYEIEPKATSVKVDFERGIVPMQSFDAIFLMRPPHIADPKVFERFLENVSRNTRIIFLSVQGADTKSYLPHAKIEKTIESMGFEHVFVRPSYFMENFLTTLWPELKKNRRVYLPAGNLELDWISVRDVAGVCVAAMTGKTWGSAVTVCSGVRIGFAEACSIINHVAGTDLSYKPAGLLRFVLYSRRQGIPWSFIAVMLLLHFAPRFERGSQEDCGGSAALLGREMETLGAFAARYQYRFRELL